MIRSATVLAAALLAGTCGGAGEASEEGATVPVTTTGASGAHRFRVELADTAAEQECGLMYRTDLRPDGSMLFAPYTAEGGPPRSAAFWMENTPSPLDILFIRAVRTTTRTAENIVPFSEASVPSGEPVAAVLEIPGGCAAELGMAEEDRVDWPAAK